MQSLQFNKTLNQNTFEPIGTNQKCMSACKSNPKSGMSSKGSLPATSIVASLTLNGRFWHSAQSILGKKYFALKTKVLSGRVLECCVVILSGAVCGSCAENKSMMVANFGYLEPIAIVPSQIITNLTVLYCHRIMHFGRFITHQKIGAVIVKSVVAILLTALGGLVAFLKRNSQNVGTRLIQKLRTQLVLTRFTLVRNFLPLYSFSAGCLVKNWRLSKHNHLIIVHRVPA